MLLESNDDATESVGFHADMTESAAPSRDGDEARPTVGEAASPMDNGVFSFSSISASPLDSSTTSSPFKFSEIKNDFSHDDSETVVEQPDFSQNSETLEDNIKNSTDDPETFEDISDENLKSKEEREPRDADGDHSDCDCCRGTTPIQRSMASKLMGSKSMRRNLRRRARKRRKRIFSWRNSIDSGMRFRMSQRASVWSF